MRDSDYNFIVIGFYGKGDGEQRAMLSNGNRMWKSVKLVDVTLSPRYDRNYTLAAECRIDHYKRSGFVRLNPIPGWTDGVN